MLPAVPLSTYALLRQFQKFLHKPDVALLKVFKLSLDHHIALIQQGQTVGDRPGVMQVMSHYNRCHLTLPLELQNQIVDLPRTDGVQTGFALVEQQNIRSEEHTSELQSRQ